MDEQELVSAYDSAMEPTIGGGERIRRTFHLKSLLEENNGPEFDELHYRLMCSAREAARDKKFGIVFIQLRLSFSGRKNAEAFLLSVLPREAQEEAQADILQILGYMRSERANSIARDFLVSDSLLKRETALFVLGWVGGQDPKDLVLLRQHMMEEFEPRLRITAASAHRQIAWHFPNTKARVLRSLADGFIKETEQEVLKWIIIMMGTVAVKNLGLREDKDNPDVVHGDFDKAMVKAKKFVASLPQEGSVIT